LGSGEWAGAARAKFHGQPEFLGAFDALRASPGDRFEHDVSRHAVAPASFATVRN